MDRLSLNELIDLERQHHLWERCVAGAPYWPSIRGEVINGHEARTKFSLKAAFNFSRLLKSTFLTFVFLLRKKKLNRVLFVANRSDLIDFAKSCEEFDYYFVNFETNFFPYDQSKKIVPADFLNGIRFLCRLLGWLFYFHLYKKEKRFLKSVGHPNFFDLSKQLRVGIGDCVYTRLLTWIFKGLGGEIFYALCVWPPQIRFISPKFRLRQLQHGVIGSQHITYIGLPAVTGETLVLYHPKYMSLLKQCDYRGKLELRPWLPSDVRSKNDKPKYPYVIFTQPTPKFQMLIKEFLALNPDIDGLYLKPHPRDLTDYEIKKDRLLRTSINLSEVGVPICYFSTLIEYFLLGGWKSICVVNAGDIPNDEFYAILNLITDGHMSRLNILDNLRDAMGIQ